MSVLKDPFFWISGAKYTLAFGFATLFLGVPERVSITLAVGALIGYPAAFAFGTRRPARPQT
jgi:hypothetical protein